MAKGYQKPGVPAKREKKVFALKSGVKIEIRQVSSSIFIDLLNEINQKQPKPPLVYIEKLGRQELNYDDPSYQEALEAFRSYQAKRINDFFLVMGTRLISCPKSLPQLGSDEWLNELRAAGMYEGELTKPMRYLLWLKTVAIPNPEEMLALLEAIGRESGVREADVEAAMDGFRPDEGDGAAA